MPNPFDSDNELSPEAAEFLKIIVEDTNGLRRVDLGDMPPATVFEAE